ncbi:thioesterase II family protein [Methylorubrum zatmanii]
MTAAPWVLGDGPADIRVVCLPYAGGGASIYREWQRHLPTGIRICRVQLPGRETRFGEPPFHRMEPLIDALLSGLGPCLAQGPYILFGHSMGGAIAAELARQLLAGKEAHPHHVMVSAARPPHVRAPHPIHELPEQAFRAALGRDGGTPAAVLESDELMAVVGPALRADHAVVETWHRSEPDPLAVPLTCFAGRCDTIVPHAVASAWRLHAARGYRQIDLDGGHFFLRDHAPTILSEISAVAASLAETTA